MAGNSMVSKMTMRQRQINAFLRHMKYWVSKENMQQLTALFIVTLQSNRSMGVKVPSFTFHTICIITLDCQSHLFLVLH